VSAGRTLALVDLDGTVLRTSAGRRAMLRAAAEVAGRLPEDPDRTAFTGRTDAWIAAELLRRAGATPTPKAVRRLHDRYLAALAEELARDDRGSALPGAEALGLALLAAAAAGAAARPRLLTGNLREGARRKLEHARLLHAYPLEGGVFGDDCEDRPTLAARAVEDADDARPVVLGDAPADVAAARAIGARVVLVATGPVPRSTLVACGPDVLLDGLEDTAAVLAALGIEPGDGQGRGA
jgi:phosphoglycolate phosphatase-like HAD superfamily hydrolase